jgi:hypothetical protein
LYQGHRAVNAAARERVAIDATPGHIADLLDKQILNHAERLLEIGRTPHRKNLFHAADGNAKIGFARLL